MKRYKHKFTPRSKYGAKKTEVDGIKFDSQKEAKYYIFLKQLKQAGEVVLFLMQVPFILPGAIRYRLDFQVFYADGRIEWVDVKGVITDVYRIKKAQVEEIYGIEIKEV